MSEAYQCKEDKNSIHLTKTEVRALNRITFKSYVHYNDLEAVKIATKLYKLVEEFDEEDKNEAPTT